MERVLKLYCKAEQIGNIFEHFATNEWIFEAKNTDALINRLSSEES
jgi:hypothetical protein